MTTNEMLTTMTFPFIGQKGDAGVSGTHARRWASIKNKCKRCHPTAACICKKVPTSKPAQQDAYTLQATKQYMYSLTHGWPSHVQSEKNRLPSRGPAVCQPDGARHLISTHAHGSLPHLLFRLRYLVVWLAYGVCVQLHLKHRTACAVVLVLALGHVPAI